MKIFYLPPGPSPRIVKPPGLQFLLMLAQWLTNLPIAQSTTRGVGTKPVQDGLKNTLHHAGMPGIPILISEPGKFLRSHRAFPPEI